jgi:hypothetical protein
MWTVYADSYSTNADFSNGVKSVRTKFGTGTILTVVRTWIVLYNNPTFSSLTMKIYSDKNGSKDKLLYSSTNSFNKADIFTKQNGVAEIYFNFDKIPLDSYNWYHFSLSGTSSDFADDKHLAWKSSYPFPVYTTGITGATNLTEYPYLISFVGAEF